MSSEISIEATGRLKSAGADTLSPRPGTAVSVDRATKPDDGFRPWHFFVLASILLATVSVMLVRQSSPESLVLISLTIASAGFAAAAFYRMLAPLTQPFVLRAGEPVGERTRAALEREKMLVLRTIKELEFDRAMGKLSQKDFDEMAGRLRTRALSLMRQLDLETGAYTAVIEQEIEGRLKRIKPVSTGRPAAVAKARACRCGAQNDEDAVFCKQCGTRLAA